MSAVSRLILPDGAALPPAAALLKRAKEQQQARAGDQTLRLTAGMISGNLYQDGAGWNGPLPSSQSGSPADRGVVNSEIERTFVSRNLVKGIVHRHRSGVAGREPLWTVLPRRRRPKLGDVLAGGKELPNDATPEERAEFAEAKKAEIIERRRQAAEDEQAKEYTDALTDWWDDSGAWLAVQKALDTALALGKGTVRLYVHQRSTVPGVDAKGNPVLIVPAGLSLSEAARRISIHAPSWDQAGVTRDLDGHVTGAYFTRAEEGGKVRWEVQERVQAGGQTITRLHPNMAEGGTDLEPPTDYPVPDLLIYELSLDPLITDSVRRLLKMANKTLTMGSRNVDLGGFLERTILGAQMPGEFKDQPGGGKKFIPSAYNVGAGVTNFLAGQTLYAKNAETGVMEPTGGFTTPSIVYKDPTAFTVFSEAFEKAREMILDEANQLHVLITGDASASGVSRQQAVNDFISSLELTRMALEQLVRWLLNTVLQMALHFTGRRPEADDFRVNAQARLSAVQPTPAEVDVALKLHAAGAISLESLHSRIAIEDSDAERATIAAEGITAAVLDKLSGMGAPAWVVLKGLSIVYPSLGVSDADIQAQKDIDLAAPTAPADLSGDDEEGEESVSAEA